MQKPRRAMMNLIKVVMTQRKFAEYCQLGKLLQSGTHSPIVAVNTYFSQDSMSTTEEEQRQDAGPVEDITTLLKRARYVNG